MSTTDPLIRFLAAGALFSLSQAAAAQFADTTASVGLNHEVVSGFDRISTLTLHDYCQQGIALADIDGDGDLDVIALGGVGQNTVHLNTGGVFTDVSAIAGIEVGELDRAAGLGDYDGDGDMDLFVCAYERGGGAIPGRSRLYRNDGTGVFEEVSELGNVVGFGHSLHARWDDLDRDGLLDLLVSEFLGTPNAWYRNNGDGGFTEMGAAVGLDFGGSTHLTGVIDADDDRLPDVVVCNDHAVSLWGGLDTEKDAYLAGQPDNTFLDLTLGSGLQTQGGLMGITFADVDYDGDLDLYKTDVFHNLLAINNGWPGSSLAWTDEGAAYGIDNPSIPCPPCVDGVGKLSGWYCAFFSADKDPWDDLLVVNGQVGGISTANPFTPLNEPNYLFTGDGPSNSFRFTDQSAAFGMDTTIDDRGGAYGDMDQDGDLDVLISPLNGPVRYYENQIAPEDGNWIAVYPECNTSATGGSGVEVRWTDQLGYPHIRSINADGPTAGQNEAVAYFGLGNEASIDLSVRFPSGIELSLPGVAANQRLTVVEPKLIELSRRKLPISSFGKPGGSAGSPGLTSPLGLLVVTAYAHDAAGNPLDATADVSIEVPGLTAKSGVISMGGNEFRRYFTASQTPGARRVEVSFNDFDVLIKPQVHVFSPTDSSGTVVQVIPEAIRAGSADTVEVRIAPRTADGILLGPRRQVELDIAPSLVVSGPEDLGDGRYRAVLSAPAAPGVYNIDVLVDGVASGVATVEVAGAPVATLQSVYWEHPVVWIQSPKPNRTRLSYTPIDSDANRLGPNAVVTIEITEDVGTPDVSLLSGLWPTGQRDGDFLFVLEKPEDSSPGDATGVVSVTVDGVPLGSFGYSF